MRPVIVRSMGLTLVADEGALIPAQIDRSLLSRPTRVRLSEIEVVRSGKEVRDVPKAALSQDRDEHVHGGRVAPVRVGAGPGVEAAARRSGKATATGRRESTPAGGREPTTGRRG